MRKLIFIFTIAALLAFGTTAFAEEAVNTGFGSLTIGGFFQAGFNFYVGDELPETQYTPAGAATDRYEDFEFVLKRARLIFKGHIIDEKIMYFTQTQWEKQSGAAVLDAKMGFKYIPYTTIWLGRILPQFTWWLSSAKLALIDRPLLSGYWHNVQRQTGFDVAFSHDYVDANFGVFNGRNFGNMAGVLSPGDRTAVDANGNAALGNATWEDENTGKDIYLNVIGKPIAGLKIWAGLWYGMPLDYMEVDEGENVAHNASVMAIDAGAEYMADFGLRANAELLYATLSYDSAPETDPEGDRADDTYELTSMGYYVLLGYNLKSVTGVPLEFLVQYDYLDPDTMNDEDKHPASETDALTYVTGGVTYYIEGHHAKLQLNYVYKMEEWEDVANKKGDDTQDGVSNDVIKFQAQVAF